MNFLGILFVSLIGVVPLVDYSNEGKYCVGPNVHVGDAVQTSKDKMTVVKIDGESVFCRNPELPVKANLE